MKTIQHAAYFRVKDLKKRLSGIMIFLLVSASAFTQYTTDKVVGKKNTDLSDSLKNVSYPYLLPIWGEKVVRKGFQLPKSGGFSAQYVWQQSDILINNLLVGFNDGPLYNLDEIVRFDKSQATTSGINVRPDFWLFPFLNIYGVLAKSKTSTAINAGVYLPDDSTWHRIMDIHTKADFDATTFGFGMTPTVGLGGFFLVLDMNLTWTDISELDKPAFAFVFGPRLGKNFTFKNPERSLAIWAGGFRVKINSGTSGSLNASELFPVDEWGQRIETGYQKVGESQQKVDDWWDGLSPVEQKNPINIAKHESANAALARMGNILNGASQIINNAGNATIKYSLDKKQKDLWNFIIGTQFQINRSWMFRAEYGFLGSRQQFIGGLQYRFDF